MNCVISAFLGPIVSYKYWLLISSRSLVSPLGPTQVKCRLLISSIFYVMNFQHLLEMLEFNLWHF